MTKNPMILTLDLATRTGWAYGKARDAKPKSGTIKFGEEGSPRPRRYREYREWFSGFANMVKPDVVTFERAFFSKNVQVLRYLFGLSEHLEEMLYETGIECYEASVSEIRMHFIGTNPRGDEGKQAVKQRCRDRGWEFVDDNAADAMAIWDYQRCLIVPEMSIKATPLFGNVRSK